ncbi:PoNe immunity protein domain-containing protein [Lentibacillus sp. Marseille-P4043]|uniref:PoNe immunity protein domain-containing protein n=1 Tax=Lentibacillus sp. Marseille-P4043 TaxID=2040293 RepID=UPI00131A555C|nr:PoNe immunity protein domain-containing protein [Lentibacillus sp. Marseille-P4043]
MVRDKMKNEKYYIDYIEEENERIAKFESMVELLTKNRGPNDKGVKKGNYHIYGLKFSKLTAMYSLGVSLEEIKEFYPEVVNIMEKAWNSDSGYVEMLWMLSIGNMLKIDDKQFDRLVKLIEIQKVEDFLYDYLIQAKQTKNWQQITGNLLYETPYLTLKQIIESNDKNYQSTTLKKYLEIDWYEGHDDMGWYASHNSKHDIYSGYWSFESGAIAQILKLNDNDLKNTTYYPYDMVHYQDN